MPLDPTKGREAPGPRDFVVGRAVRLQSQPRIAVKRGDLIKRQRRALGIVKRFNERPFDAHYIQSQALPPRGKFRMVP